MNELIVNNEVFMRQIYVNCSRKRFVSLSCPLYFHHIYCLVDFTRLSAALTLDRSRIECVLFYFFSNEQSILNYILLTEFQVNSLLHHVDLVVVADLIGALVSCSTVI